MHHSILKMPAPQFSFGIAHCFLLIPTFLRVFSCRARSLTFLKHEAQHGRSSKFQTDRIIRVLKIHFDIHRRVRLWLGFLLAFAEPKPSTAVRKYSTSISSFAPFREIVSVKQTSYHLFIACFTKHDEKTK